MYRGWTSASLCNCDLTNYGQNDRRLRLDIFTYSGLKLSNVIRKKGIRCVTAKGARLIFLLAILALSGLAIQLGWLRKLAFTAGSYCGLESHPGDFRKGALVAEERKLPARPSVPFKLEAKQDSNLRARVTVILIVHPQFYGMVS